MVPLRQQNWNLAGEAGMVSERALLQELCLNYNPRVSSFITLSGSYS